MRNIVPVASAAALLLATFVPVRLDAGSFWKCKDGTGSRIVSDSGTFKLDGRINDSSLVTWAREDDRGFFLNFRDGGSVIIPHDDKLLMRKGFDLSIRFSCDLSKIRDNGFACLLSKGDAYDHGYSVMVSKKGGVLVNLNGLTNHYAFNKEPLITSGKDHCIRVVYSLGHGDVYVDGNRVNGYPTTGVIDDKREPLHLGGIDNYPFTGNLYSVLLAEPGDPVQHLPSSPEEARLMELQNFKAPQVDDPPGTVVIKDFSKFSPAGIIDYGGTGKAKFYVIRTNAEFWGNGISTMVYPPPDSAMPDLVYDPKLTGKYDVYLSVRSTANDSVAQAAVGNSYYRVEAAGLGPKHRSYEVLLERNVDMTGRTVALAPGNGAFVGYFKLIPSATPRRGEVPDPAGKATKTPRMTQDDLDRCGAAQIAAKFKSGHFRERVFVETRRCAIPSDRSRERGYQLFERNWMDLLFPVSVPTEDTGKVTLRAAAAPGEFEPVTLGIRALRDIDDLKLTVSGFTGPDGKPAPVECSVGRVENLVKRSTAFTGNSEVIDGPIYIEESDTMNIRKDSSRQFWLTLRAPEDASAGVYRAEARLSVGKNTEVVPLEFEVYPFKLDRISECLSLYGFPAGATPQRQEFAAKDFSDHGMTCLTVGISGGCFAFIGDTPQTVRIDWENSSFRRILDLTKRYGLDNLVMLYTHELFRKAKEYGVFFEEVYTRLLSDIEEQRRRNDWPQIYYQTFDEILSEPHLLKAALEDVRIQKKLGLHTCSDHIWYRTSRPYQKVCDEFSPLCDLFILRFSTRSLWYVDVWPEIQRRCKAEGKQLFAYNSNNAVIFSQPAAARYSFGWFHRTAGADTQGHLIYIYEETYGNPYNDLDGNCTDWTFRYPRFGGRKGGPSLDWEAYREGADDLRYITTLENRIRAAEKAGIDASEAKTLLARLAGSMDMKKFYAESLFITPKWDKTWDENGKFYASGTFNVPNGWKLEDYDRARREIANAIISLDRKLAAKH